MDVTANHDQGTSFLKLKKQVKKLLNCALIVMFWVHVKSGLKVMSVSIIAYRVLEHPKEARSTKY